MITEEQAKLIVNRLSVQAKTESFNHVMEDLVKLGREYELSTLQLIILKNWIVNALTHVKMGHELPVFTNMKGLLDANEKKIAPKRKISKGSEKEAKPEEGLAKKPPKKTSAKKSSAKKSSKKSSKKSEKKEEKAEAKKEEKAEAKKEEKAEAKKEEKAEAKKEEKAEAKKEAKEEKAEAKKEAKEQLKKDFAVIEANKGEAIIAVSSDEVLKAKMRVRLKELAERAEALGDKEIQAKAEEYISALADI